MQGMAAICAQSVEAANMDLQKLLIKGEGSAFAMTIAEWHKALSSPVAAKWAKPVARLVGSADGYNAIAYRDLAALAPQLDAAFDLSVATVYKEFIDEEKRSFWQLLDLISQMAAMGSGAKVTSSPTLDEIRQEITRAKGSVIAEARHPPPTPPMPTPTTPATSSEVKEESTTETGLVAPTPTPPQVLRQNAIPKLDLSSIELPKNASVTAAVGVTWAKLIDLLAPAPEAKNTTKRKAPKSRLRAAMEKVDASHLLSVLRSLSTPELEEATVSNDIEAFVDLEWAPLFADEKIAHTFGKRLHEVSLDKSRSEAVGEMLSSIFSFAKVESAVPNDMLQKIESTTTGLLQKLKSGETTLQDLDLQKLGESVLSSCTDADKDMLGDNIAELLPVLQRGFASMPPGMKIPGL